MKFLVLGCNGMVGHVVSLYLKENGHDVIGYARNKSKFVKTIVGDVTNCEFLKGIICSNDYDAIINCVGVLNQFAEENHALAVYLNGYLPHFLAKITTESDTQIIHLSTDCVFSGQTGGYTEDSMPDGRLFYDRSKAIGELEDEQNITLRCSIVGPDINQSGIGLLNWFLQQNKSVKGFQKAIWTGQTTLQLAKTIEEAAKQRVYGLYNMVPDASISKYELLILFNKYIRKKSIEIIPDEQLSLDKSLIRTRHKGFAYEIPAYEKMVKELGEWMREHKELYPHYEL